MLAAGRELDALVAENVMGWKRVRWCDWQKDTRTSFTYSWHDADGKMTEYAEDCDDYYDPEPAWSPSTDIAAAWEVVEKLLTFENGHVDLSIEPDGVNCDFAHYCGGGDGLARSAPLAICLAALKAVGYEPKETA